MICALCHQGIDLFDLDTEGVAGLPAHASCAEGYRAELAKLLREVELMIMAEPDPRRHRHHVSPPA
ncbi:MAG: hypothetical protein SHS37scaffold145_79 [Phage 71_18]|jgi:hypothetical protein|nr:MAG: hypothetical protein SHS37scaffold145_79 [Phage 71_18]